MADNSSTEGTAPRQYVVVARRYRPQLFEELIGQEHVAKGLAAAIAASRVGHAYLFTGARGTGKTSTARILAKALNCEKGPTPTPCNECDNCLSITSGADLDVLEIDGASNNSVEEIRELRQNVNVRPSRARFKIYIIDEVHMLSKSAFNALLKTLEEPPEHVKFIFCTTEPEKIPITIVSRCQRYDFAGIQTPQIVHRLEQIVVGEGVEADPEALEILARRAAGSMRDSQSLLEQLLAFGSRKITVADVHRLLGTAGSERIARLVNHLIEHNAAAALAEVDQAVTEGTDVGQLLDQLLGYFRDVMAAAVGCPPDALLHVSTSEQPAVKEAAGRLGLETILAVMQILDHTLARLRYLSYPRTVMELGLVRICQLENLDSLSELIAQLREGVPVTTAAAPRGAAATPAVPRTQVSPPAPVSKKKYDAPHVTPPAPAAVVQLSSDADQLLAAPAQVTELTEESAFSLWQTAAETLGGTAAGMAKLASNVTFSAGNKLVVYFAAKYNSGKLFCERPETASKLQRELSKLAGQSVTLAFQLQAEDPAEQARPTSVRQRIGQISQRPFVRQAMELFDATPGRLEEPERVN